ncbi:MAG: type II secretion system protein GspG, partial [Lentisphaeria bacterium]|nr:type II secretion system protein GspG [Lentisphaeria bacterium]
PVRIELSKDLPDNLNGTLFKYLDEKLLTSATKTDGGIRYFVDGWDRPLIFRIPGKFNKMGFDLGSVGADGKIGEDGTEITATVPSSISDYETKFGQGDDITNFLRKD